jgi:phage-related tail protein
MAIYKMDDGRWVNTDKAQAKRDGVQKHGYRQTLYRSSKGEYYIVDGMDDDAAFWVSDEKAVLWLLSNGIEVPEGLDGFTNDRIE